MPFGKFVEFSLSRRVVPDRDRDAASVQVFGFRYIGKNGYLKQVLVRSAAVNEVSDGEPGGLRHVRDTDCVSGSADDD